VNAQLTRVDQRVLDIAEKAAHVDVEQSTQDYFAIQDIMKEFGVGMAQAATMLVQARMSEAALKELTK
jgi:hypothetical protein